MEYRRSQCDPDVSKRRVALARKKAPMKLPSRLSLVLAFTAVAAGCSASSITKSSAEKRVAEWYEATGAQYKLDIKDVPATITRFDPENPNAGRNEIRVTWKGMVITLSFSKPIDIANLTTESLAETFSYVSVDDVFAEIETPGWKLRPSTPSSSHEEGVQFQEVTGEHLRFTVDWETYAVVGYSNKEACQEQLKIADNSLSKDCIVNVEKRLPLHLQVDATL